MPTEDTLEFRQVGDTWLHASHEARLHGLILSITNERTYAIARATLTTAMARQLRDWLLDKYPLELLTAAPERPYQQCGE